jgi:hypothetical protein
MVFETRFATEYGMYFDAKVSRLLLRDVLFYWCMEGVIGHVAATSGCSSTVAIFYQSGAQLCLISSGHSFCCIMLFIQSAVFDRQ